MSFTPEQERKLLEDVNWLTQTIKGAMIGSVLYVLISLVVMCSTCRSEVCDTTWLCPKGYTPTYSRPDVCWKNVDSTCYLIPAIPILRHHCPALDSLRSEVDALKARVKELEGRVFGDGDSIPVLRNRIFIDTTKGPQYIPLHGTRPDTLPPDSVWVEVPEDSVYFTGWSREKRDYTVFLDGDGRSLTRLSGPGNGFFSEVHYGYWKRRAR
jgi:hypothetical protein